MNYYIVVRMDFEGAPYSDYSEYKQNEKEEWSKFNDSETNRNYKNIFEKIQKNDKILCYKSHGKNGFCALLRAGDKNDESVFLHFEKALNIPLATIREHFEDIKKCFEGEYSFFTKSKKNPICNGTYFASNKRQFELICGLDGGENFKNLDDFSFVKNPKLISQTFTTRHATGEKAEQFFKAHYAKIPLFKGMRLQDTHADGLGYDFELVGDGKSYFVEVKGVRDGECDCVLFTQKEWQVADKKGAAYILAIVNLTQNTIQLVPNPSRAKSSETKIEVSAYNVDIKPLCEGKNLYKKL